MSLLNLFNEVSSVYEKLENGEKVDISDTLEKVLKAIKLVESSDIYSKNEELEDVSTNNLKVWHYDCVYKLFLFLLLLQSIMYDDVLCGFSLVIYVKSIYMYIS